MVSFFGKCLLMALIMGATPSLSALSASSALISEVPYLEDVDQCRMLVSIYSEENPDVLKSFDEAVAAWKAYALDHDFDLAPLLKALSFAAVKHEGQVRKDAARTPYIIHPLGVARILFEEADVHSSSVLIAALLHDTLEDTDASAEEIEKLFGEHVKVTVEQLTNSPGLTSQENKQRQIDHAPSMSHDAQLIKLADRLYNIRDLRNPPPTWSKDDIQRYLDWGQKLLAVLPGVCPILELTLQQEIVAQKTSS